MPGRVLQRRVAPMSDTRAEYVARVNRVVDHIQANLDADLSLAKLARIACFSPYHFHRIFCGMMGETCNRFVRRLRVERAATKLRHSPGDSITAIALDCGFSGPEPFARVFRDAFGMSASQWRAGGHRRATEAPVGRDGQSKIGQVIGKLGQVIGKLGQARAAGPTYGPNGTTHWTLTVNPSTSPIETKVEVVSIPLAHVAYIRHRGPYAGDEELFGGLFGTLTRWAGPRGLLSAPDVTFMTVYHDDPAITHEDKLRISVCVTVPEGTPTGGEIGGMTVAGGRYARARFEIDVDQYAMAWNALYGTWLPDSGYQPDQRPSFERHLNNPQQHPEHKHIVELYIPIRPL